MPGLFRKNATTLIGSWKIKQDSYYRISGASHPLSPNYCNRKTMPGAAPPRNRRTTGRSLKSRVCWRTFLLLLRRPEDLQVRRQSEKIVGKPLVDDDTVGENLEDLLAVPLPLDLKRQ